MPAAIIGAYHVDARGEPLATRPLVGLALAEHQVRRAAAAGFSPLLLLSEAPTGALAGMVGRLRRDGLSTELVADLPAAAGKLPRDAPVLLLADAVLPTPALLEALADAPAPLVATLPDTPEHARHERIDAGARWAGVALTDGGRVAETAAMLGGWDPVSTLLRRLVQEGAARVDVAEEPPLFLADMADLVAAERALVRATRGRPRDWIARHLFTRIEDQALPPLLARRIEPMVLVAAAAVLALVAGLATLPGLRWPPLLALLAVGPLAGIGRRLARVQARPVAHLGRYRAAERVGAALAALGLGRSLMVESGQWGWALVATMLVGAMVALAAERPHADAAWLARRTTLPWVMFPLVVLLGWAIALALITLFACLSFAAAQRERLGSHVSKTG